jgi:O-antigen/teichoic acid export membrane protein
LRSAALSADQHKTRRSRSAGRSGLHPRNGKSISLTELKSRLQRTRFTGDLAVTLSTQIGVLGLGIASSVLAARLLGPEGRGELAAIVLWPTFLVFLFGMGNTQSIVFHTGKRRFEISEIWTAALMMGLALSACALIAGFSIIPVVFRQYSPEARRLALFFLAFVPLIWLTGIPTSLLQGRLEMGYFNLLRLICPAIYAAGFLALYVVHRPSLEDAVILQVFGFVALDVCGFWLVFRKLKLRWAWNSKALRSIVNFGWKTQVGDIASYVNQRMDQLLLTLFVPPRDLGLYVVAVTVSMSIGFFPQAAGIVTLATGSNSDPEQARRVIARSFTATFLVLAAGCGVLYFACPWLIPGAFGASFAPAVTACRILLPGSVALGLNQVLFNGARALDHPALPSFTEGFAVAVTGVSLYVLLPRFGLLGAAMASTLAYVSSLVFMLVLCRSRMQLGPLRLLGFASRPVRRHAFSGS